MTGETFPPLSLAHRPELFAAIAARPPDPEIPLRAAVFGDRPGWLVADYPMARRLLTSTAGRKSRPDASQTLLGGVGAQRGARVRDTKRLLIHAMGGEARDSRRLGDHLRGALRGWGAGAAPGRLTEAFSTALLTQLTGGRPGALDGDRLRALVLATWERLEHPHAAASRSGLGTDDDLAAFIHRLVGAGRSPFLDVLRADGWDDRRVTEELRSMLLAGWGSTTAATVTAMTLGLRAPLAPAALDEVLRLCPPSFMIARTVTERSAAGPFAPGDLVVASPWLIHRNAAGWHDPLRFDPERRPAAGTQRWFLPFGAGPRRCPAATFARAHVQAALRELAPEERPCDDPAPVLIEGRSPALRSRTAD
jgi:cytochrome P450